MGLADKPIPRGSGQVDGWQKVRIIESNEPIVRIGAGTEFDDLLTSAVYAGEHTDSPYQKSREEDSRIYVRLEVAKSLQKAQAYLLDGLRLVVLDGLRSRATQAMIYRGYVDRLKALRPALDEDQLSLETQKYVSLAVADQYKVSPHMTGGAVDVAILKDGHMLNFGTAFDHASSRSWLDHFEDPRNIHSQADVEARRNRRILFWAMKGAGFEGYSHEWWHFNSIESQMGAQAAGRRMASYGYIEKPKVSTKKMLKDIT